MMKTKKVIVIAVVTGLAGCAFERWDGTGQAPAADTARQALQDWGDLFPRVISGPTLVQWQVTTGSSVRSDYGIRIETRAGGTLSARFDGCSVETVQRAFDLMRSKPQKQTSAWTWNIPCPGDAIAAAAKLFVQPDEDGYSYLELSREAGGASLTPDAGDAGTGGAKAAYLVIPNRCANLVKYFGIVERAASLPAGSTDPTEADFEYLRAQSLVPLVCGQERTPTQTVSVLGVSQLGLSFTKRRAVFLRRTTEDRGDVDVFFHAIDGQSVDTLWKDRAGLLAKLKEIGTQISATVATQLVNGVEELDLETRGFPVGTEAWDLQTRSTSSGATATPMHRRWGTGGKLNCLSGADPSRQVDGGPNAACEAESAELKESLRVNGSRPVYLHVSHPDGSEASIALPECAAEREAPNWKSLLRLGSVPTDTRTWIQKMESDYGASTPSSDPEFRHSITPMPLAPDMSCHGCGRD
jgi:hypothetical protein